jgi:hypothetical protein
LYLDDVIGKELISLSELSRGLKRRVLVGSC